MRNYTTIHTQSQIVSPIQGYSVFDFPSVLWDESRPGARSYRMAISSQFSATSNPLNPCPCQGNSGRHAERAYYF